MKINENFTKLPGNYLFSEVARKLREFENENPDIKIIRMDIGDVTLPLPSVVTEAMRAAVDEMGTKESLHGYGPEQGYLFLRQEIAHHDYKKRGITIEPDDIFISDGAKSDLGNLGDIYSTDSIVGVADPGYPVYVDSSVMDGRAGDLSGGKWNRLVYLDCDAANGFIPEIPDERVDVVFLCSPSNPTGAAFTRQEMKKWVDYALRNETLLIFDSAYEAFVREKDVVRSIYEIEGAEKVAIEVRSFSKTAGFTGVRCGYTVVPRSLFGKDSSGGNVSLNKLWNRRQCTKFNGVGYIVQKGAEALYTPEGQESIKRNIDYYLENAKIIREKLQEAGFIVSGGINSPYIWAKSPDNRSSWELFQDCLEKAHISGTPGVGFGQSGEGYIRLTGFNSRKKTEEAMRRISESNLIKKK